jgi:hypothetical protein
MESHVIEAFIAEVKRQTSSDLDECDFYKIITSNNFRIYRMGHHLNSTSTKDHITTLAKNCHFKLPERFFTMLYTPRLERIESELYLPDFTGMVTTSIDDGTLLECSRNVCRDLTELIQIPLVEVNPKIFPNLPNLSVYENGKIVRESEHNNE